MSVLGGIPFEGGFRDRRLLWRDYKLDFLIIGLGMLIAFGLFFAGLWVVSPFAAAKVFTVYVLGGALYGSVMDYYIKGRCEGGKPYPADWFFAVLTTMVALGDLFLVRLGAGWALGPFAPSASVDAYALAYNLLSLFFIGVAAGGVASHTVFEQRYGVARWYRTGKEPGTRRRRTVFYLRPLSRRPRVAPPSSEGSTR